MDGQQNIKENYKISL